MTNNNIIIIPDDSNRVLLLSENGQDLSDYINASYILVGNFSSHCPFLLEIHK